MTDENEVNEKPKRKPRTYVTKTAFQRTIAGFQKTFDELRADIMAIREKLAGGSHAKERALPEISDRDDAWILHYETDLSHRSQDVSSEQVRLNAKLRGNITERDNPQRLAAMVHCHAWPLVVVLAFIMDEELQALGLQWPEGTKTSDNKPRIIRWGQIAAMAQIYTMQNGFQNPISISKNIVRELLQVRALIVERGRVRVHESLRRVLTKAEPYVLPR